MSPKAEKKILKVRFCDGHLGKSAIHFKQNHYFEFSQLIASFLGKLIIKIFQIIIIYENKAFVNL